jgi:DNA/RNA endonuclease G (NUC1)
VRNDAGIHFKSRRGDARDLVLAEKLSAYPHMNIRRLILGGVLAPLFTLTVSATQTTSLQMQLGNASGATADGTNHNHYLLQCAQYSFDYSDTLGEPNWVAWDLTASDVGTAGRSSSFFADTRLPAGFYEVKTGDYTNSGFDRGHMCPSADRTDTSANNLIVFYMSNILPQTPDNNQGPWEQFEAYCRTQASGGYEVLITSGPSIFNGSYIPSGVAAIPGYTWKFAVFVPTGAGTALSRITSSTRIIALKMPNIAGIRTNPWQNYITSTLQLQTDTGYSFLTALPAATGDVLRAKVDGATAPTLSSFSPGSGAVGSSVTITGTAFTSASKVKFNGTSASFTVNSSATITATVPAGATTGPISVIAPGGLATSSTNYTVTTGGGGSGGLVISQVYGGGGNSGATYINDFIELYNGGSTTINLSTYAVQYTSAAGSSWSETILNGTLAPGHHYLIQEAAGTGGTQGLPTPQATGSIALSASSGKVALTKTTTLLTVDNPSGNSNLVDFVGYGTADAFEGAGAAPTLSNTTSALRANAGATDTNNNAADFSAATPNPRNN